MEKLNTKHTRNKLVTFCAILIALFSAGCLKERVIDSTKSDGSTFFREHGLPQYDKNFAIAPLKNNKFIIGGTEGSRTNTLPGLYFHQIDNNGFVSNNAEALIGYAYNPYMQVLKNEDVLIADYIYPSISKYDSDGKKLYSNEFKERGILSEILGLYRYSKPSIEKQNNMHIALCHSYKKSEAINGKGLYGIMHLDASTGLETSFDTIPQKDFDGLPFFISILKSENNAHWLLTQEAITDSLVKSTFHTPKLFLKKVVNGKLLEGKELNMTTPYESECLQANTTLTDNSFVIISGENSLLYDTEKNSSNTLIANKVDTSFKEIWKQKIVLDATSIECKQIKENALGELLLLGTCSPNNSSYKSGFMVKLSSQGSFIDSKIIDLGQHAEFEDFIELEDGSFIFVGGVNNFGNSLENMNRFYLKTDKNYNY